VNATLRALKSFVLCNPESTQKQNWLILKN
jgi:hypothetical protein